MNVENFDIMDYVWLDDQHRFPGYSVAHLKSFCHALSHEELKVILMNYDKSHSVQLNSLPYLKGEQSLKIFDRACLFSVFEWRQYPGLYEETDAEDCQKILIDRKQPVFFYMNDNVREYAVQCGAKIRDMYFTFTLESIGVKDKHIPDAVFVDFPDYLVFDKDRLRINTGEISFSVDDKLVFHVSNFRKEGESDSELIARFEKTQFKIIDRRVVSYKEI